MQRAKSMPRKAMVTLAGEDIIDKPIVKPNVQKLRYATNCHYLVVMIQFHCNTDHRIVLAGFHGGDA